MELHRTEQGFALYKEKDCIGECTLSPAPKGAQLARSAGNSVANGDSAVAVASGVLLLDNNQALLGRILGDDLTVGAGLQGYHRSGR